ncbi:MAG: hypothetical protein ACI4NZ_01730 [Candidatus Enterousia sp.]
MRKLLIILFTILPIYAANCNDAIPVSDASEISENDIISADVLLAREPDATECATAAFADALAEQIQDVPEDTPQSDIETLIYAVFSNGATLERVVACPEIANADEMDNIKFLPIKYTFPGGREIVINYETQPKIIKQRLSLANRANLPAGDPSPRLGDLNDPSIWTNTDPAWYGIIVTESGALSQFVGNGKNNTISLRYIEDNIDSLMPQSKKCTSGSALADDDENINQAVDKTVGEDQDYYVSGDVNLQWISYLEIGLDVVITVATFGGGAVISGVTKAARAARVMRNLSTGMRALAKTESVTKYIRLSQRYAKLAAKAKKLKSSRTITNLDRDLERAERALAKTKPGSPKHAAQQAKVNDLKQRVKALDDLAMNPENAEARQILENGSKTARQSMKKVLDEGATIADPKAAQEMEEIAKTMRDMERTDKNVKQYKQSADTFAELNKYRHQLLLLRRPAQRGNIATRTLKSLRAANKGTSAINDANKVAQKTIKQVKKEISRLEKEAKKLSKADQTADNIKRLEVVTKEIKLLRTSLQETTVLKFGAEAGKTGAKTGRLRDWLFHSSMKNIGKLGRMEEKAGLLYGAMKFAGDMYDWSETSTGDYTSGIQFKPLLLLSADDIEGQENVVNHGMWLLWQGDTYSASDDDAAYLQAMDFAEKFYRDLLDVQSETNDNSCNVDIYVVRPIIRNPGEPNAELYYLIMNDTPWSTANQQ